MLLLLLHSLICTHSQCSKLLKTFTEVTLPATLVSSHFKNRLEKQKQSPFCVNWLNISKVKPILAFILLQMPLGGIISFVFVLYASSLSIASNALYYMLSSLSETECSRVSSYGIHELRIATILL